MGTKKPLSKIVRSCERDPEMAKYPYFTQLWNKILFSCMHRNDSPSSNLGVKVWYTASLFDIRILEFKNSGYLILAYNYLTVQLQNFRGIVHNLIMNPHRLNYFFKSSVKASTTIAMFAFWSECLATSPANAYSTFVFPFL